MVNPSGSVLDVDGSEIAEYLVWSAVRSDSVFILDHPSVVEGDALLPFLLPLLPLLTDLYEIVTRPCRYDT